MKEQLTNLINAGVSVNHKRNILREYIQIQLLRFMQPQGSTVPLALRSGGALRIAYAIPRYVENLYFTLEHTPAHYNFSGYLKTIQSKFQSEHFTIQIQHNDKQTIHYGIIRFPSLLFDLGLSQQRNEALRIKIEVNTQPPSDAMLATTVLKQNETAIHVQHYDQASLLADNLYTVLTGAPPGGRDLYDLMWLLQDPSWPEPNIPFLSNALRPTDWNNLEPNELNWRQVVGQRLEDVNWKQAKSDIIPFLENKTDVGIMNRGFLLQRLEKTRLSYKKGSLLPRKPKP